MRAPSPPAASYAEIYRIVSSKDLESKNDATSSGAAETVTVTVTDTEDAAANARAGCKC